MNLPEKQKDPKNQKKRNYFKIFLIIVIFLLLVSNGISIGYILYREIHPKILAIYRPDLWQTLPTNNSSVNLNVNTNSNLNTSDELQNSNQNPNINSAENPSEEKIDETTGEITVDWYDWPITYSIYDLNYEKIKTQLETLPEAPEVTEYGINDYMDKIKIYKVGTIKQGPYAGEEFLILTLPQIMSLDSIYRFIKKDEELTVLAKYSENIGEAARKLFTINNNLTIANLEPSDSISIPNSNLKLYKNNQEPYSMISSYSNPEKLFKYDGQNYLYKDKNFGCFIAKANDGTAREYYFDLDFTGKISKPDQFSSIKPYLLEFTLLDGNKNQNEYIFQIVGGCGPRGCYSYADYITNVSQLEKIGQSASGEILYKLKDINLKARPEDTDTVLQAMYNSTFPGYNPETKQQLKKESFEKFLNELPILYWQDPFGDFIEFRNAKYLPIAECGKPVIYLYPEKETSVSVQVKPTGGLKISEPAYNNGWQVLAQPTGELFNYADQQKYPYLFWEGYGLNYWRPNEGFVVKKSEVKNFLREKLAQLGLIKIEADEFIEFWLPKMQENEYYFITFVPQSEFDKLAPLEVFPKPDTIIRIFMDYQGLNNYVNVKPQIIKTPTRIGFTVVEWGGALHH